MVAILLVLGLFQEIYAQTKVEVLTKTVEKRFGYVAGNTIKVVGESARINITGWERSEVKVVFKLIAKGLTKSDAARELDYQKYLIENFNKEHVIKNFLLIPNELKELKTIQETEMMIFVPKDAILNVENKYGETSLNNLDRELRVVSEYGYTDLSQVNGDITVESNFGDLLISNASGEMKLILHLTKTTIDQFKGVGNVKSNLGDLRIKKPNSSTSLRVNSTKSDVKLELESIENFSWYIKSKYGELIAPSTFLRYNESKTNVKLEYGAHDKPLLNITTDFGTIEIIEL